MIRVSLGKSSVPSVTRSSLRLGICTLRNITCFFFDSIHKLGLLHVGQHLAFSYIQLISSALWSHLICNSYLTWCTLGPMVESFPYILLFPALVAFVFVSFCLRFWWKKNYMTPCRNNRLVYLSQCCSKHVWSLGSSLDIFHSLRPLLQGKYVLYHFVFRYRFVCSNFQYKPDWIAFIVKLRDSSK